MPPGPVKISHRKMATKGGRIELMFLGPLSRPLDLLLKVLETLLCLDLSDFLSKKLFISQIENSKD